MAAPFQNYSGGVLLADVVKRNNLSTYVSEAIKDRSLFLKSGAIVRNSLLDARQGGTRIQVPEFNPTAPTEEIMDGTATWGTSTQGYLTPQKIGTATQIATICHRGFAYAVDDVAMLAAGEDPMLHIRNQLADAINKLNSARLFSQLAGLFGSALSANSLDLGVAAASGAAEANFAAAGVFAGPEMRVVRPLLELQARWSRLPEPSILLAETLASREGHHLFVYPFAGRHANLGLACLLAWRASRGRPATISVAVNDYGFELLSAEPLAATQLASDAGLVVSSPADDLSAAVNAAELSRRRFREIARIAGLVFQGHPRERRSARSLQASASMFHEVFDRHDPGNLLLAQARREVLAQELEIARIEAALAGMRARALVVVPIARPTPFAFPLMVERLRETVSTEKLADRVARMVAELEEAARC